MVETTNYLGKYVNDFNAKLVLLME